MDRTRPILADGTLTQTLVLVGLMGAGKSTVGRRLAHALNVDFVDSDDEIVKAAGMPISEIFARLGEPHFRDGERRVLARLLQSPPHVLATGGGAFVSPENREIIAAHGVSIWLRADLETLWDRVRSRPGRPLLEQDEPKAALAALLAARTPAYAKADYEVTSHMNNSHEVVVQDIFALLKAQSEAIDAR
ncbi:shikimate kinase [Abyssibius alkaniclasticus]|uniref:shikimate kinase n=1 Tax=Abyssibius alkaniclasticus TaxID=2881234 RepID=UPI0023631B83|nr:shikimate kinase [Abyssibius alkaniclasticus]UPH70434.1 shikimate kinase [Abyssibius alkaniclasticus]